MKTGKKMSKIISTQDREQLEKEITELQIQQNALRREGQYEDVWQLEEKMFDKEKIVFLSALEKFKQGTMELAESWICCNEILENLTMNNSYPFDTDFQSMELHILKWADQLKTKINNYKGEE